MRHGGVEAQPFEGADRAVVAQDDRRRLQQRGERLAYQRLQRRDAGGVGLHDEDRPEPVDDETRQSIRLGMNEAVIGPVEEPLAQGERALQPGGDKAPVDRPPGVAVEEAGRHEAVRVEHGHTERALVGAAQRDKRAGRQRLGGGVNPQFVRKDPGMPGLGAAMAFRRQHDRRPGFGIVRRRGVAHGFISVGASLHLARRAGAAVVVAPPRPACRAACARSSIG